MQVLFDGLIYTLQHHGGISRYTSALAQGLREAGIDVVTTSTKGHVVVETVLKTPYIRSLAYPFLPSWLRAEEKKYPATSIVHVPYVIADYRVAKPSVITIHDLMYETLPEFNMFTQKRVVEVRRKVIERASAVVCVSQATAQAAQEFYRIPQEKIYVTPLGVEKTFFDCKNQLISRETSTLLYVGNRSSLYKNFKTLLAACARLKHDKNWKLVCVGGGHFSKEELQHINSSGLDKKVEAVPFVDEATLKQYYQEAALVVVPSLAEGFGLPLVEAMATGTPLLVSDIAVFREVAQDTAHYFTATSVDSLTEELTQLLEHEAVRTSRVEHGIERARIFSWENTARATIRAYTSILPN